MFKSLHLNYFNRKKMPNCTQYYYSLALVNFIIYEEHVFSHYLNVHMSHASNNTLYKILNIMGA